MNTLLNSKSKNEYLVIGVLSGTSVDGVDIVLISISGSSDKTKLRVLNFKTYVYDEEYKNLVLKVSDPATSNVEDVCKINFLTGFIFAEKINEFVRDSGYKNSDIDFIGSHGQTIYHIPVFSEILGYKFKSTLQIGDISVIANKTGILTVGDFRCSDVAVNGDGAPLAPYLDYIMFKHFHRNRILINIGGISNLTYLPSNCNLDDILAFDTGPGNMVIDYYTKLLFNYEYDESGSIAESGTVNKFLLEKLIISDDYFLRMPPKSTGRERYGKNVRKIIDEQIDKINKQDIIRTITEYTIYTITESIKKYIPDYDKVDDILLSGGGAKNKLIREMIGNNFHNTKVSVVNESGINTDNKEAVLFAVLANETVNSNFSNVRKATGAERNVILGKISLVKI